MKTTNQLRTTIYATSLLAAGSLAAQQQPNILFFMVDDMGWQDSSEPFWSQRTPYNDICYTPTMERLARQGVKFTQAYACAVSSPSRTSYMTGMNAARHRVSNWTLDKNTPTDAPDNQLTFPSWNYNGLQPVGTELNNALAVTNLAELLRQYGYHTIHCGKAHWGASLTPGANPENLGFDVNIAGSEIGGLGSYYGLQNFGSGRWQVPYMDAYHGVDINLTEALTLEALKSLNERPADKPFFLHMSHYTVHVPIMIDNRFKDNPRYAGISDRELAYLTMLEGMDKSLGDILDWLETNNEAENTIVIFMSDNGGHHSVGNITIDGKQYRHQYPLRGSKGSIYEGGIREPMLVKWPGVTIADTVIDEPVIIEDFFPSILEMAGIDDYTTIQVIDGVSFVPFLQQKKEVSNHDRELYWHYPHRWGEVADGSVAYSAIRLGDYKFIYRWHSSEMELYSIKDDIGENNNLLASSDGGLKSVGKELAKRLSDYLRAVDAQRPACKSTANFILWPDEALIAD
jgi:arylsulfatase A-like enzyme